MSYGFGVFIKDGKKARGYKTEDLANKVSIHRSTLSRFEKEEFVPSPQVALDLQRVLGLPDTFIKLCERARLERTSRYKEIWTHAHPYDYVGDVWIRIRPAAKHMTEPHKYVILTYAQHGLHHASCRNTIYFDNEAETACLVHRKIRHSDLNVVFHITPAAEVTFGYGTPPCKEPIMTKQWKTKSKLTLLIEVLHERGYLKDRG